MNSEVSPTQEENSLLAILSNEDSDTDMDMVENYLCSKDTSDLSVSKERDFLSLANPNASTDQDVNATIPISNDSTYLKSIANKLDIIIATQRLTPDSEAARLEVLVLLKNTKDLENARCQRGASCTLGKLAEADKELEAQRIAAAKLSVELEEARRSVAERNTRIVHLAALLDTEKESKEVEFARLEADLTTERQHVQRLRAKEKDHVAQLALYQADADTSQSSVARLVSEKSVLEGALASERQDVQSLKARQTEHIAHVSRHQSDLASVRSYVARLRREKARLDGALAAEKQTVMRLKTRESEHTSKVLGYQADLDAARAWIPELDEDIKTGEKRYARLQREKDKLDINPSSASQALEDERAKRLEYETELNDLKANVEASRTQYKESKLADRTAPAGALEIASFNSAPRLRLLFSTSKRNLPPR
ncbi:hypothetical protein Moror_9454 [Moniliophthora roreri MCA 2997]|uniref:Uncharacterized protein n=1 Tax=Moniliophthora roreri (strain MCA 2997) TaxID=1381753 RepID=V2X0L1_MONRO|nr:hypothetical protein Moror_9454 [Moniliophthora roreri MCA 2997]